jgi:hypothetical protein
MSLPNDFSTLLGTRVLIEAPFPGGVSVLNTHMRPY